MTGRHYGWHKAWQFAGLFRLRHESGLEFDIQARDGFTDINADSATLDAFQAHERGRGVPPHDIINRLRRLVKEAGLFYEHAQNRRNNTRTI